MTDALLTRLAALRDRVAALVDHRATGDPTADDPLRGLYLSEEAVRHLLGRTATAAGHPAEAPTAEAPTAEALTAEAPTAGPGAGDPLTALAHRLPLNDLDVTVLLIALAPDLDRTFESLYGYLNDDVSRRRATVGLALDLCGAPAHLAPARAAREDRR